jgi:hypothetical protein
VAEPAAKAILAKTALVALRVHPGEAGVYAIGDGLVQHLE